jgi:hypothetical protein
MHPSWRPGFSVDFPIVSAPARMPNRCRALQNVIVLLIGLQFMKTLRDTHSLFRVTPHIFTDEQLQ